MFELTVPPGSNVPPLHSHTNNEEIVYVSEGTLRYTVDTDKQVSQGPLWVAVQTSPEYSFRPTDTHGHLQEALNPYRILCSIAPDPAAGRQVGKSASRERS
jgi:hypothetical protein